MTELQISRLKRSIGANAARSIATAILAMTSASLFAQTPARPGDTPRSDPSRSVTLSLTEYNRLIDLASRPPQGPALAPVGAVLSSANLRVRVERDSARGVFNLAGDVLRPGINKVPLVSSATLIEGNVSGRPLPLDTEGGIHAALLPGPGPFAVTLEWGTPLTFGPGRASFVLPAPYAGTVRATIDVPGDQADVHISAGLITKRSAADGRTTVDVTLRSGVQTEVWWSMRDSAPVAAAREVRLLDDVLTLMTLGDSDVRMVALVDVTVVQGEPRTIVVRLPGSYELTSISGSSLESTEQRDGNVTLALSDPAARRHQFLITLERPHDGGSFVFDTVFPSLPEAQRERGEVGIEGVGTLDLTATAQAMHRVDVRELNQALQSLARMPILAAFRYQRAGAAPNTMSVDVKRFADAGVLAAVSDRAVATTLVTSEGRALTEIKLHVQNRAQPFLKVALPAGATIVSAEVADEPVKPALGTDGTRIPLLRPGLKPNGGYTVSFVYMHAGSPFARKGEIQMTLPKMDVPIGVVEWELFVPDSYNVKATDGNVIDRVLFPVAAAESDSVTSESITVSGNTPAGQARGSGASGSPGAAPAAGGVSPAPPPANTPRVDARVNEAVREAQKQEPSQNVINLQKRAAGVLPVRVDVPRAGTSHQFVRPLVVDQETFVNLRYKRR